MLKKLSILVVLLLLSIPVLSHAENYAIRLDRIDDFINIPHSNSFNWNQQATIECWVRIFDSNSGVIFNKFLVNYEDKQLVLDSRRKVTFHLHGLEPAFTNRWSHTALNINQWYHITGTAKADSLYIYVNGYLDTCWAASGSSIGNSTNPAVIGAVYYRPGSNTPINGEIDEFRIWNTYKTPEQIRAMMYQEATGNEPGLVAVWHFNEGQGQTAYDSSPNHNDGRLGSSSSVDPQDPRWVISSSPINGGFQFPVDNYLNSIRNCYGWGLPRGGGRHVGEDVKCNAPGTPVYAMGAGIVKFSGPHSGPCKADKYNWGTVIVIEHTLPDNSKICSIYGHIQTLVNPGQQVKTGQQIATIGDFYCPEGWTNHLHFGIYLGAYGPDVGTPHLGCMDIYLPEVSLASTGNLLITFRSYKSDF